MQRQVNVDRPAKSRSLRGNVDRNVVAGTNCGSSIDVVPYVGTWIEIFTLLPRRHDYYVVPYVGTWIEILILNFTQKTL